MGYNGRAGRRPYWPRSGPDASPRRKSMTDRTLKRLEYPVAIFSRLALNGLLLERARRAGVAIHKGRITRIERSGRYWQLFTPQCEYRASYVVHAAGARNSFRAQFLSPISPSDLMVTAGYFIPGRTSLMQIQFLQAIDRKSTRLNSSHLGISYA